MDKYTIIKAECKGSFSERLMQLYMKVGEYLDSEKLEGRKIQFSKVFLSDAQNQYQQLIDSDLYQEQLSKAATTVVEQPPVDGCKIALLLKTSDQQPDFLFHSIRLTNDETNGMNSYTQTIMLFEKYLRLIKEQGLSLAEHCVRTWLYVADIDNNYQGVVKARNQISQPRD